LGARPIDAKTGPQVAPLPRKWPPKYCSFWPISQKPEVAQLQGYPRFDGLVEDYNPAKYERPVMAVGRDRLVRLTIAQA